MHISDLGLSSVGFDFIKDGFDSSKDELDFGATAHNLNEEFFLNKVGQRL